MKSNRCRSGNLTFEDKFWRQFRFDKSVLQRLPSFSTGHFLTNARETPKSTNVLVHGFTIPSQLSRPVVNFLIRQRRFPRAEYRYCPATSVYTPAPAPAPAPARPMQNTMLAATAKSWSRAKCEPGTATPGEADPFRPNDDWRLECARRPSAHPPTSLKLQLSTPR